MKIYLNEQDGEYEEEIMECIDQLILTDCDLADCFYEIIHDDFTWVDHEEEYVGTAVLQAIRNEINLKKYA